MNLVAEAVLHDGIFTLRGSEIASVSIHDGFFSGEQFGSRGDVGSCHLQRVNKSAVLNHPNVCFVSEVSLITLLHLMRFRITQLFVVFGGGWCRDDGGIYNRALLQKQSLLLPQLYYLRKQLLLQAVVYENVPKTPQRIAVWHLIAGLHAAEARKSTVVDFLGYQCFVGKIIQVLQQIQPQHQFQVVGFIPRSPL